MQCLVSTGSARTSEPQKVEDILLPFAVLPDILPNSLTYMVLRVVIFPLTATSALRTVGSLLDRPSIAAQRIAKG